MGRFSFLPQIRKDSNSKNYLPSFDSKNLLNKMIFTKLFDNHPDAVFIVDLIDHSFIRQITKATHVEVIIKSLISMAKGLNINVVAEGVESHAQLAFLKQQECHEIQGYIFSKPVSENKFQSLLKPVTLFGKMK